MLGRLKFELDELANELLNSMPEDVFTSNTSTFIDPAMGGGQFIKAVITRLRKYGHSDKNITSRVFGYETNKMRVNFAKKQCQGIGTFTAENFLEWETDMKFDVVVGNPPYQDGNQTGQQNKIYNQFSKKAIDLSNRIVAFVTPTSVCKNSKRFSLVGQQGLSLVDFNADTYFNVGATICSWIIDKSYNSDVTVVDSNGNTTLIESNKVIYDYAKVDRTVASIVENIRIKTKDLDYRMFPRNNPGPIQSKEKTNEFKYPLTHVNKDGSTHISGYMKKEPYFCGKKKFIMIMTRSFVKDNIIISNNDYDDATVCVAVESPEQISNLQSFLFSEYFVDFVGKWKAIDGYGFNEAIKYLPKFDMNKHWTNKEVKEFIESHVK